MNPSISVCLALTFVFAVCPLFATAKTMALVVGNAQYQNGPDLKNPAQDVHLISKALQENGIHTTLLIDATKHQFLLALAEFRITAKDANKVIIYFAGHGVQMFGESYLLPSDASFNGGDVLKSAIPVRLLVKAVSNKPRQKLIFIDACRDNPAYSTFPAVIPKVKSTPPAGLFILHSAQPGAPASDGTNTYSPFAAAVFRTMQSTDQEIETISRRIRLDVIRATGGNQIPWSYSSLLRPFTLLETVPRTE